MCSALWGCRARRTVCRRSCPAASSSASRWRALVHSPPIIIADEPTGNIDPELSVEIMELLQAINSLGTTIVVVTHEHDLAARFKKRTILIDHGEVVDDGVSPYGKEAAYL